MQRRGAPLKEIRCALDDTRRSARRCVTSRRAGGASVPLCRRGSAFQACNLETACYYFGLLFPDARRLIGAADHSLRLYACTPGRSALPAEVETA